MKPKTEARIAEVAGWIIVLAIRAVVIMFFAAVVKEQFDVWTAMGFWAAMAWSLAVGVTRQAFWPNKG